MGYAVAILPRQKLGVVRLTGSVAGPIILQALDALYTSEEWVPGFNTLWDGRQIMELGMSPADVEQILEWTAKLRSRMGNSRAAVVVERGIDTAFARMIVFRDTVSGRERSVFNSLREALQWLQVEAKVEPIERELRSYAVAEG